MARAMEKSAKFAREVEAAHHLAGTPATTMHQDTMAHLAHSDSHGEDVVDSVVVVVADGDVVVADGDVAVETITTPRRERERSPNPLEKRVDKP